jgi:hypothetical protein
MEVSAPPATLVRILANDGRTVGTGFFVSTTLIVTCAHVVQQAHAKPGSLLTAVSHATDRKFDVQVVADYWTEPDKEDVAVLELNQQQPPPDIQPAKLASSHLAIGENLETFGYPVINPLAGLPGRAEAIGAAEIDGQSVIQVRSPEIAPGYSGAPAWLAHSGLVVGMVVSVVQAHPGLLGRHATTAFLIPTETIRRISKIELPPACPYRRLEVFEEEHRHYYYGRDAAIAELLNKLQSSNLVVVAGASGSGKSSLVRAGLPKGLEGYQIPGLADRKRLIIKPGRTPFSEVLTSTLAN